MTTTAHLDRAAFFDLDRTLISVNSAFLYAAYERRRGTISWLQFAQAALWMGLYHLSIIDIEGAFAKAVRQYRGIEREQLIELTKQFFKEEVVTTIQPGAIEALGYHRQRGDRLVLLTASSAYMSELASEEWGLEHFISNDFPIDDKGRLLGTYERPICYGQGKVYRAQAWARQEGIDLSKSYFYSDSHSDLPMLKAVGHPRVINPDPRLKNEANRRGWPIQDWTRQGTFMP